MTTRKVSKTLTKVLSTIDEDSLRRTRDRMLIAVKIADILKAKGLTQKKFALMMGKSESEISEILSGDRNFTLDTLSDIANCLGVNLIIPSSTMPTSTVSDIERTVRVAKVRKFVILKEDDVNSIPASASQWMRYRDSESLSLA